MKPVIASSPMRQHSIRLWTALLLCVTAVVSSQGAARLWTDQQGRTVQAEFAGLRGGSVSLRTADGRLFQVPLERLTQADQQVARDLSKVPGAPTISPAAAPVNWQQSAARIDQLVNAHLATKSIKPNPPATDEQFVRRIYLDIAGRIPSYDETTAFLNDRSRDKRSKLIDQLLASKSHFSHLFNYLAEMLRLKTKPNEYIGGGHYVTWIRECIEKNVAYDVMVRQMLTATGTSWENPAAGYLLRDAGMPLDNLALTMQVFAGLDLSCAQCHDHPFADWTQMEFYGLAAFFGQCTTQVNDSVMRKKLFPKSLGDPMKRIEAALTAAGKYPEPDLLLRRMVTTHFKKVVDAPERLSLKLPHDYQYKDGKPGQVIEPKVVYGAMPNLEKFDTRRAAFADWLTISENDRFSATIANRLWKRAFGMALAEPVTEMESIETARIPDLMRFLADEMKRVKFDLRAFQRILYNTQAYQRAATVEDVDSGVVYHFPGPLLRRMSAEQIWDSFITMILPDPDYFYRKRSYTDWEDQLASVNVDDVDGAKAMEVLGDGVRAIEKRPGGAYGWAPGLKYEEGGNKLYLDEKTKAFRMYSTVLVRASEYPQPASNFFLLGQGDRNLVDGSSREGSVPVVLTFMNSDGTKRLTEKGSRILDVVDKFKADGPKVEAVFLSVLSRMPDANERSIAYKAIRRDGPDGFRNVVWALINTREFLFIQ